MRSVMISIKPEWVEKIEKGRKTIEFRKIIPKCNLPCKYYIYATKPVGKVVDEFILNYWAKFRLYPENKIVQWREESDWTRFFEKDSERRSIKAGCVPFDKLNKYLNGKDGYALYIDDLKIYDKPKELSEFKLTKAPQSWCYVEELEAK